MEYQTEFLEHVVQTPSSISYRFKRAQDLTFTAGQYMVVDLGDGLSHPLSLSNCPEETEYIEFTKRMTDSPFSKRLQSLKKGESITVKGPFGKFTYDPSAKMTVMIAGGIGITPIRSILASLEKRKSGSGEIILLYGNLNKDDITFRDELHALQLSSLKIVHALCDTAGMENAYEGFITADIIAREVPDCKTADYMVSGPPAMVEAMKKALSSLDVSEDQIRADLFIGY